MSRIYISGQIGEDSPSEATVSRFRIWDNFCQRLGHETFNPCSEEWQNELHKGYLSDQGNREGWMNGKFPEYYDYCLLRDMMVLSTCDAIFMVPGWEHSPGACVEFLYAKATNKKILYHDKL